MADGISMGTEGMKYSLVSREVIADSIETVCNGQSFDGVLALGGCDKNMPGAMMAIGRLNIPAVFVYGGTIKPGHHAGRDLTVVSAFEAVGEHAAGRITDEELAAIERNACPGAGSCGGMFTANTMSSAIEAMGMSLPYSSTMATEDAEKAESAAESARVLADCIAADRLPRDIVDAPGAPERRGRHHSDRGFDERGAAPARHRACGGRGAQPRRLRAGRCSGARPVRPEAQWSVCDGRLPSCRRRASGHEGAARARCPRWRLPHGDGCHAPTRT